jgi:hypothetical protein
MRVPFESDSHTLSAISFQHTTSRKETDSFQSLLWASRQRRLTATPNEARAAPDGV